MLCGSVDARRAGEYMAEVRTSSQCERPCAGIEETRKAPGDAAAVLLLGFWAAVMRFGSG